MKRWMRYAAGITQTVRMSSCPAHLGAGTADIVGELPHRPGWAEASALWHTWPFDCVLAAWSVNPFFRRMTTALESVGHHAPVDTNTARWPRRRVHLGAWPAQERQGHKWLRDEVRLLHFRQWPPVHKKAVPLLYQN